jgi:hypothetical protein
MINDEIILYTYVRLLCRRSQDQNDKMNSVYQPPEQKIGWSPKKSGKRNSADDMFHWPNVHCMLNYKGTGQTNFKT